jgi:hypothetical protein
MCGCAVAHGYANEKRKTMQSISTAKSRGSPIREEPNGVRETLLCRGFEILWGKETHVGRRRIIQSEATQTVGFVAPPSLNQGRLSFGVASIDSGS